MHLAGGTLQKIHLMHLKISVYADISVDICNANDAYQARDRKYKDNLKHLIFFNFREKVCTSKEGGGEREGGRENLKQAPCSARSPTRSSIP